MEIIDLEKYLDFLREDHIKEKQTVFLREKIYNLSSTLIGRRIGITENAKVENLPLTSYPFYKEFFEKPAAETYMYPLSRYVRAMTSGTMGAPKWYMLPAPWIAENFKQTGMAVLASSSHDGNRVTLERGDVFYAFFAPKPFVTGYIWDAVKSELSTEIRALPEDQSVPIQEKIEVFVKNHQNIHTVTMPLPLLSNLVYPQIGRPLKLKGYIAADAALETFRDKTREMTGARPSTLYASTETGIAAIPAVEVYCGLIFDWRNMFCEFLPEGSSVKQEFAEMEPVDTVLIEEVKPGARYQLVVTPFNNDLIRYVMPDLFECVQKGDDSLGTDLPVFKFIGRTGGDISLHNFTRITEKEILIALKESGVLFENFTARREIEGSREYLALYLEPKGNLNEKEATSAIDECFAKIDKDYASLIKFYQYTPLKIKLLPPGTFAKYLESWIGTAKQPERVGMKEENFQKLLAVAFRLS